MELIICFLCVVIGFVICALSTGDSTTRKLHEAYMEGYNAGRKDEKEDGQRKIQEENGLYVEDWE